MDNPVLPIVTPQVVVEQPKSNFLVILLSTLLIISVAISGFFAYQTQKLVKELTLLRLEPTLVATIEPTAEPVATESSEVDSTANWKTYTDSVGGFSFKYPGNYLLEISDIYPYLNKNITWRYNNISTSDCRGDCPLTEKTSDLMIDNHKAKKLEGYIGEVGGNIAQRFVNYEIQNGSKYFLLSLQATPQKLSKDDYNKYYVAGKIIEIKTEDKLIFDQILSTFKFNN